MEKGVNMDAIYSTGSGVYSLERPLKPAIMQRIDRITKLAARRVLAVSSRDKEELMRLAAEYAQMKYMQNTARQVAMDAERVG